MNFSVFGGCLIVSIIAFILFLILYGDEFLWVLKEIPNFFKTFFMAIAKSWRFAVQGVLINCKPIKPLKVKNKKAIDCKRKYVLNKIKEGEDLIDEDKAKEIELNTTMNSDQSTDIELQDQTDEFKESFVISKLYNKRRKLFKEEFGDDKGVFYINPKTNNPLVSTGYINEDEAEKACKILESELATKEQLITAYNKGVNWCSYGWVKDGNNSEICLPLQPDANNRLSNEQRSSGMCGSHQGSGVNCIRPIKGEKYGANCYGKKPPLDNNLLKMYEIK